MQVEVRLFASLREKLPNGRRGKGPVELPEGATLPDLLGRLDIPRELAQMVLINGEQLPNDWEARAGIVLRPGDTISIFPPVAGG